MMDIFFFLMDIAQVVKITQQATRLMYKHQANFLAKLQKQTEK